MHTPHIPPDFTDEASYRAYLKAVANGQVRIKGETLDRQQAQAQLAALNGNSHHPPHIPPDFTDEASYRAYLKAEANGQARVFGKKPCERMGTLKAGAAASIPPDFTDEASYRAYLKAEANGQVRIFGKPETPPAQPGQAIGLAAMSASIPAPIKCVGRNGEWVKCPDLLGIEHRRPAA